MLDDSISDEERKVNTDFLTDECEHLLTEIERLQMNRQMQDERVQNVTHLVNANLLHPQQKMSDVQTIQVYAMVNIEDSRAMKRLSYITMIFLPGSFMAVSGLSLMRRHILTFCQGVFGMNVIELNSGTYGTLRHYVAASLPLTLVTIWIIVAYQSRFVLREDEAMWKKLLWPIALIHRLISRNPRGRSPLPL